MHPMVVLVSPGSTLFSFMTTAIYMFMKGKVLKQPRKQEENTPKTKIFLATQKGCTPIIYLCTRKQDFWMCEEIVVVKKDLLH